MKHATVIRASALEAADEAFHWYEAQRPGLGSRFKDLLAQTVERIAGMPLSYPEVEQGVRRALVPVLKYRVFYLFEDRRVVVIGIYHPARDVSPMGRH